MATLENIGVLARVASTFGVSTYFGGVLYCSAVECPSRKKMKNGFLMLDNWQETFPRAMSLMRAIALASLSSGFLGWYADTDLKGSRMVLGWSLAMFAIFPWTYLGIMPTNYQLLDYEGSKKKGEEWIRATMDEWAWRHGIRTVLSGCAMGLAAAYWTNIVKPFM